ncbi:hypothetical protein [Methanosarcina spelaei]|nr:hypothetical protein [Methanosarcina spelaei]
MAKGNGLALCRILNQAVDILPGSHNAQRARAGKKIGGNSNGTIQTF